MTEQDEIAITRRRMLNNAIQHLIKEGVPPDEARTRAEAAPDATCWFRISTPRDGFRHAYARLVPRLAYA
jgi:hypothetical protein